MSKKESLRAQDVLVACKLFSLARPEARRDWTYAELASDLGLSASTAHESVDRCRCSGLLLPSREVSLPRLRDLLVVAVPRIFYASRGGLALGMATGTCAPPLRGKFKNVPPIVWPNANDVGRRGEAVDPIYPSAPLASIHDEVVYELLALIDVLRTGSDPERTRAVDLLDERLFGRRALTI